jgi:hypothetical protein
MRRFLLHGKHGYLGIAQNFSGDGNFSKLYLCLFQSQVIQQINFTRFYQQILYFDGFVGDK